MKILVSMVLPLCLLTSQAVFAKNPYKDPSSELFKERKDDTFGCENLRFYIDNDSIIGRYQKEAQFPNPPERVYLGGPTFGEAKPFEISCPEISAKYDGNIYEFKAKTYQDIWKYVSVSGGISFYYHYGYKYPAIRADFYSNKIGFNPIDFQVFRDHRLIHRTVGNAEFSNYKDVVIGYKIDNGKLEPLLYNGKLTTDYQHIFAKANEFQLFYKQKEDYGVKIQSVYINKSEGVIRLYRKMPFPNP